MEVNSVSVARIMQTPVICYGWSTLHGFGDFCRPVNSPFCEGGRLRLYEKEVGK